MMFGWAGKILEVNLSNSKLTSYSTQPYADLYLGGRGIASKIYWETVTPEARSFDPENRLIFMTGPLVGTGAQGATRLSVISKSPMTLPEGFCYGSIGGFIGVELKNTGFDGIVIKGRAPKPVYIWIHDQEVEICDATSLWGHNAYHAGRILQHVHGEKSQYITTGVAGENKVRTAVIVGPHFSAASAGFGAVMGAKNLKALVFRGTLKPSVADRDRLKELNRYTVKISKGLNLSSPPQVALASHSLERIRRSSCSQCGIDCLRGLYRYSKRLEGYRKCQPMDFYWPQKYSRKDEPIETYFYSPVMANDYSIDTWELQSIIDWLYECHKAGILSEKETGLPLSKIGTREFLEKLLYSLSNREGFGDILAEGLVRAGDSVSNESRALFTSSIAPIGMNDWNPPRIFVVNSLLYPMEPRIHHNILHEIAFVNAVWSLNQLEPGSNPITTKVVHRIARAFWGSNEAGDLSSYEGKALAAKKIQNRTYIKDSLALCDFAYPITCSLHTPDYVGDPDLGAKFFNAVTGIDSEEFDLYGDRICNLQRLILLREGRIVPEADYPPDFNFTEPYQISSKSDISHIRTVPGPGDKAVPFEGNVLERDKFDKILTDYYLLRGWNHETGQPLNTTLTSLGLEDLISGSKY